MLFTEHMTRHARVFWSRLLQSWIVSEEDWDLDKEMIGWELGESLVLLPLVLSVEEIWNNDLDEK